jgi:oligopeptide transport system substrate-binding protein
VTHNLFTGLVAANFDGSLTPMLATSRTSNADCTEWTFKIKQGTKFSNGEAVDASSFVRGWTRVAVKASASVVAYHMAGIKGFADAQSGKSNKLSGVTAPDPSTLKVDLSKPDCEFDVKTVHSVFSPVPKVAGAGNNKAYNEAPIGNGPFKMKGKWEHNKSITLVRNDDYGFDKAHLDEVDIAILNGNNGVNLETAGFKSGQFDWARMPVPQLTSLKKTYAAQNEWIEENTSGMNFIMPIGDNGPFKTKDARLAVSYAIDRNAVAQGVFKGFQVPSSTIVPPSFKSAYQAGACTSCLKHDPAKAKAYAKKAGLGAGTKISFAYNTGSGNEEWVQAMAKEIEDTLGWKVELKGQAFAEMLDDMQKPNATGLYRYSWGADYPTPDNFLYPLLDTASINKDASGKVTGDNRARWSNPKFDSLIDQARKTRDDATRSGLYKQAEKIALDDGALIPTFNRTQYRLADTKKFAGLGMNFFEEPTLTTVSLR